MRPLQRSALAQFWCGVAPLRLKTERYKYINLPGNERKYKFCTDVIESEMHVLIKLSGLLFFQRAIFTKASSIDKMFSSQYDTEKFIYMFTHQYMTRVLAKTCFNIVKLRNNSLYWKNNIHACP